MSGLVARGLTLGLAVFGAAGCAVAGPCPAGFDEVRTAQLLFGRDIGQTLGVSDADWRAFVAREVTPRFPDGFTVIDAQGQWRGAAGHVVREPSKMLLIVLKGDDDATRLAAIARAYETRFKQESVLLIEQSACATFRP